MFTWRNKANRVLKQNHNNALELLPIIFYIENQLWNSIEIQFPPFCGSTNSINLVIKQHMQYIWPHAFFKSDSFSNQIPFWIPMYLHASIFRACPAFRQCPKLLKTEIASKLNAFHWIAQCIRILQIILEFSAHSLSVALTLTIEFKDGIIAKMKLVIYHWGADGSLSAGLSKFWQSKNADFEAPMWIFIHSWDVKHLVGWNPMQFSR